MFRKGCCLAGSILVFLCTIHVVVGLPAGVTIENQLYDTASIESGSADIPTGTYIVGLNDGSEKEPLLVEAKKDRGLALHDCDLWMVPLGFGRIAGDASGICKEVGPPSSCHFTHVARHSYGLYIAGLVQDSFFKMVQFDAYGVDQPGSGRYYRGGPPADAMEMVSAYDTALTPGGSGYVFVKLDDFGCYEAVQAPTTEAPFPEPTPAPTAAPTQPYVMHPSTNSSTGAGGWEPTMRFSALSKMFVGIMDKTQILWFLQRKEVAYIEADGVVTVAGNPSPSSNLSPSPTTAPNVPVKSACYVQHGSLLLLGTALLAASTHS